MLLLPLAAAALAGLIYAVGEAGLIAHWGVRRLPAAARLGLALMLGAFLAADATSWAAFVVRVCAVVGAAKLAELATTTALAAARAMRR